MLGPLLPLIATFTTVAVLVGYGTIVLFECFEQSRQPNTVRRYCSIFLQTELLNSRPKVANCLECSSAIFASMSCDLNGREI